jgi:hypothetical protein
MGQLRGRGPTAPALSHTLRDSEFREDIFYEIVWQIARRV